MDKTRTPSFRIQSFGPYILLDRIAVGGMAEIFKAKQSGARGFEKIVVIKKILQNLNEDQEFVEMFEDEAKIAAQLNHANIVQIYELGEIDGTLYIAMELVEGKNLRDITRAVSNKNLHLSLAQSIYVISEVLKGVDFAHRKTDNRGKPLEIIHRDMSPQNIVVSYEGEVKILDFGIAKAASKISKTEAGVLKGKFSYMSPEQASGRPIDQTTDIYACGVILHELLTGQRLYRAETDMETLERVRTAVAPEPSSKNPEVPQELDKIVLKALARDSEKRFQTAGEFLSELSQFAQTSGLTLSSQQLSAFMNTLFEASRDEERKRLLEALAQVPATAAQKLNAAKTHIAFKAEGFPSPVEPDEELKELKPSDDLAVTSPTFKKKAVRKKSFFRFVAGFLFLGAVIAFLWSQKHNEIHEKNQEASIQDRGQEPSQKTAEGPGNGTYVIVEPEPAVDSDTETSGSPEKQVPIAELEPAEVPPQKIPPEKELRQKMEEVFGKVQSPEINETVKSTENDLRNRPEAKLQSLPKAKIHMVATGEENWYTLYIDQYKWGRIPDPKALEIEVPAGTLSIKCLGRKIQYTGKVRVGPNQHITISCDELSPQQLGAK